MHSIKTADWSRFADYVPTHLLDLGHGRLVAPGDRLDSIDVDQGHDSTLAYRRLEIGFRLPWI